MYRSDTSDAATLESLLEAEREEEESLGLYLQCSRSGRVALRCKAWIGGGGSLDECDGAGREKGSRADQGAPASNYSLSALYLLAVNYVLGVGCLSMPFAFANSGLSLGIASLLLVSVVSWVCVVYVGNAVGRAEALAKLPCERHSKRWLCVTHHKPLLPPMASEEQGTAYVCDDGGPSSPEKSFELTSLVFKFCGGASGESVYRFSLMGLMYIGLLAYTQVFVKTMEKAIMGNRGGGGGGLESVWLTLGFGAVVVPLSCLDLTEQVPFQAAMAAARFVSIGLMIVGSVLALAIPESFGVSAAVAVGNGAVSWSPQLTGAGLMFSTSLFSQLFQHSVPGLIRPLRAADKPRASYVFAVALSTTLCLYIGLGVTCALCFGSEVQSSINLNFAPHVFRWGAPADSTLSLVCSYIVLLFPALDTISVFPLIAITLGNNLVPQGTHGLLRRVHEAVCLRKWTCAWRILAAAPPVLVSLVATDLALTVQIAGVFGIAVAFATPAILELRSAAAARRQLNSVLAPTSYGSWLHLGSRWVVGAISAFAACAFVVVVVQIALGSAPS